MFDVKKLTIAALVTLTAGTGCAKNVERFEFTKWGNSYLTQKNSGSADTTAQGGVETPVKNENHIISKASVGGAYKRAVATSPSYRLIGGFHHSTTQ